MQRLVTLALALCTFTGCGTVFHREMLGKAVAEFTLQIKDPNSDKIWIANMADSECDSHASVCKGGGAGLGCGGGGGVDLAGGLGGLVGGGKGGTVGPYDKLAWETFANYITQKKKGRVVESHRHNYATELQADTHVKVDAMVEGKHLSTVSCEDLCLLDEAKKRKADKILVYSVLEMTDNELKIHLRYSDVKTGTVDFARTLHVLRGNVLDLSF